MKGHPLNVYGGMKKVADRILQDRLTRSVLILLRNRQVNSISRVEKGLCCRYRVSS